MMITDQFRQNKDTKSINSSHKIKSYKSYMYGQLFITQSGEKMRNKKYNPPKTTSERSR